MFLSRKLRLTLTILEASIRISQAMVFDLSRSGGGDAAELGLIYRLLGSPTASGMGGELLQLPLSGDVQHGSSARVGLQKFPAYVDPSLPELIQSTVGEAEAGLLTLDPSRRTTAAEALRCAFMDPPAVSARGR
jgi:hypothetical protein